MVLLKADHVKEISLYSLMKLQACLSDLIFIKYLNLAAQDVLI